jgi:hypothetical protein
MQRIDPLEDRLRPLGLCVLGEASDGEAQRLMLVGNAGSAMWPVFRDSPEFSDGRPDPLDRWTRRVGQVIAEDLGAGLIFPFDGPPYAPFLHWSAASGAAFASPLSMFIHARYGLWHAYRFALCFEGVSHLPADSAPATGSPCTSCAGQPCLDACPNDAFGADGYQLTACLDELKGADRGECLEKACAARRACPVARAFRYDSAHAAFHMGAFLARHAPPAEPVD